MSKSATIAPLFYVHSYAGVPCLTQKTFATLMTDQAPTIDQLLKTLYHAMLAYSHRLRRQLL